MSRERLRGVLHVHSTWSDGELTLAELRETFLAEGCRVVCTADHAEYFDAQSVAAYVAEAASLSDERLRIVPGLEFGCEQRMHIVGFGVTALVDSTDPETVIRHIARTDGVGMIAHPKTEHFPWIESFAVLPQGIEAWNSKYDGRYGPRAGTFALIRRLQARRSDLRAFYGQDLHWRRQFRGLVVDIDAPSSSREHVLGALAAGAFEGRCGPLAFPSTGEADPRLLERLDRRNRRSTALWHTLKRLKAMSGRLGRALPPSVKAQLRRIF